MFFLVVSLLTSFCGLQANCEKVGQCPEFDKFAQKFIFSQSEKMKQEVARCQEDFDCNKAFQNVWTDTVRGLPSIYFKGNDISRVINADRMRRCIEVNGLTLLGVAHKYVGKTENGWQVFAEKISSPNGTHISLELVKQLVKLAEETGYRDWNSNWFWDGSKLVCIDTDSDGFTIGMHRGVKGMEIPNHCKFNYVASLKVWESSMREDARDWFYNRLNELVNSTEGLQVDVPLPFNTKYDDPNVGFDFEQVKKEFYHRSK